MEARGYDILTQRELGRYLRFYRKKAGFTAKQVADRLGYSNSQSVFNIESGKSAIAPEKMYAFLRICGIDPDEAFTEPFGEVDSPDRRKKPGSLWANELMEIFRQLDASNQKTLLAIARWALRAQDSQGRGEGE